MAKSRVELLALRHLREAYDALAEDGVDSSSTRPLRSGRVVDTVRSLQPASSEQLFFRQWQRIDRLRTAIDEDVAALLRETTQSETPPLLLPIEDDDEQDPKWRVLFEVLGADGMGHYTHDLFTELAVFRSRCGLYGATLQRFIDHVQLQCLGPHSVRSVVSHAEWREMANAAMTEVVLVSQLPVVLHHCSPPTDSQDQAKTVVVAEVLALLTQLPPPRKRLTTRCFVQLADSKRGQGIAPPPDSVRVHRLTAVAKQSLADTHCSRAELEEIVQWLETETDSVTLAAFLAFHVQVSDRCAAEDAEFLAFLSRVWQFDYSHDAGLGNVQANFDVRGQQLTARVRKQQVLKKLEHVQAVLPPKLAALRQRVAEIATLSIQTVEQLQGLPASAMVGLRVLQLVGVGLADFPTVVVSLPAIEELELGENQLASLPLDAMAAMKSLRKLGLRANKLTDRSFSATDWREMTALAAVDLGNNRLSVIPSWVAQLGGLRTLSVASNRLQHSGVQDASAKDWRATDLETLDLRDNQLTALPDAVISAAHKSLQRLYAQDNQLSQLPPSLASCERLNEVALSKNRLHTNSLLPASQLARCSNWVELAMDHNRLTAFPVSAPTHQLDIQGLRAIRLANNRLKTLPTLPHLTLSACEELDVQANRLTTINDSFWAAFPSLRVCKLQQNALVSVSEAIASCCPRLRVLEAFENQLASVPASLSTLKELVTLNLRDNQLTSVPTEWHELASHRHATRQRVLQMLSLHRNPLKNRVLLALVEGNSGGKSVTYKPSTTTVIEMYLRKLIDTLKATVAVQRLARAVHAEELDLVLDSDDEFDEEESGKRRRWKGRARFVLQYIETQLHTLVKGEARQSVVVTVATFTALLQRLLVASTTKELQLVADRFAASKTGWVDGRAFLCGVERVGLFDALAIDGVGDRRSESVHKPVDAVESILQYLHVAHEQRALARQHSESDQPLPIKVKASALRRPQSAGADRRPVTPSQPQPLKQAKAKDTKRTAVEHTKDQRDSELERQRVRIRVLEQQLMDQRLLRMTRTTAATAAAVENEPSTQPQGPKIMVHIKPLNSKEPSRAIIAMGVQQTTQELKAEIAIRLQIPIQRQVLVTKRATDHRNVRLHGETVLATYAVPGAKRIDVTLIVCDQVQVDWQEVLARQ